MNKDVPNTPQLTLSPEGSGETQCVVFAGDYKMARRALGKYNAVIVKSFPFISAYGVLINVYCIDDLKKMPCIREVCANSRVTVNGIPRRNAKNRFGIAERGGANVPFVRQSLSGAHLNEDVRFYHQPRHYAPLFPRGRTKVETFAPSVAFIDTGFSAPLDFYLPRKRLKAFVDFVNGKEDAYDDNGHGTAVGCLIACDGRFTLGSRVGTAAGADLVALKAIEEGGSGSVFRILEAMQWVYDNAAAYRIGTLCMSLGGKAERGRDPLCEASAALWRKGITVVASAGNAGENGVTSPGCCGRIITVGSAESGTDGKKGRSPFSSYSPELKKPDVCADGNEVECVGVDGEKVVLSGTSLSAPIVAGVCSEIIRKNPHYTPDMVKRELISRAEYIGEVGTGYGYIKN